MKKGALPPRPEDEKPEPAAVAKAAVAAPAAAQKLSPPTPSEAAPAEIPLVPEDNRAPPGWSPTAKAAFGELPADHPIRLAVAQREVEINKGFAKLTEYKPIERYAEMAKRGGTTLEKALEAYTGIEQELGRDFIGGIARICQNRGVNPVALANEIIARNGGSPSNSEPGTTTQAHQTAQVDPNAITQTVLAQLEQREQEREVNRLIKEFGGDPKNTFFENVRADMASLLGAGYAKDIPDAYQKACWANDEIRPLLIKQQAAPSNDLSAKAAAASQARALPSQSPAHPFPEHPVTGPNLIEDEIRGLMNASV
jgi:hypothetical protein